MTTGRRGDTLLTVLVFVTGSLLTATGALHEFPAMKAVVGADCILRGGVPYRDFWTMYAPGEFYAVAGLFAVFGRELLVQAIAASLLYGGAAAVFLRILRHLEVGRGMSLALTAGFVVMRQLPGLELTSYPPALLLILLALLQIVSYYRDGGPRRLVLSGFLLGTAAVFKHDVAAYSAAAVGLSLIVTWFLAGRRRPSAWIPPVSGIARIALPALAVVVPVAVFLAVAAGRDAWEQLIVFPLRDFAAVRAEGYPSLVPPLGRLAPLFRFPLMPRAVFRALGSLGGFGYGILPILTFVVAIGVLVRRGREIPVRKSAVAILLLILIVPFFLAAHVQQNTHLFSMAMLSMLIFGLGWTGARARPLRALLLAFAIGMAIPLTAMPLAWLYRGAMVISRGERLDVPGARALRISEDDAAYYRPVVAFLRSHTRPGEPIFSGVRRNGAIVISNERFYFLADRPGATRYCELHPGVTDRRSVQEEIIRRLRDRNVRCIVLWHFGWPRATLDRIEARNRRATPDGGSDLLDRVIDAEYEEVARYGEYAVLWKRGVPLPAAD